MEDNQPNFAEQNECVAKGICATSPVLSSMQAVILVYLEELAFYLLELNMLGAKNEKIKNDIIDAISGLIVNVEYSKEHLNQIISTLYGYLYMARELYTNLCAEKGVSPFYLKTPIKISKNFEIIDVIKQGQKYFIKKEEKLDAEQKRMYDVLFLILKSICLYIVQLRSLNVDAENAYREVLTILSMMNFNTISSEKLEGVFEKYIKLDHELMQQVFEAIKAEFGGFMSIEASFSSKVGKAILVSGSNLKDLEALLNATEGKGIDIYTHGQMVVAHTLPKFKAYPHFVGHWGRGIESYLADFSSFPGAIFLTTLSLLNVEHIYSGSIFTMDKIAPKGIAIVKDNDFEPLIQSALSAEGFEEDSPPKIVKFGVDEEEFFQKINEVAQKIETGEIKHFFAVGVSNHTEQQRQYFEELLDLIEDDSFVLSFSYTNNRDNVYQVNADYAFPLLYKALKIVADKKPFAELKPGIFATRCEPHTISNFFYMKYIGIEKIYFAGCSSHLANPALIDSLRESLGLRRYTNPRSDLDYMLKN